MRALVCTRTSVQEADLNCLLELTVLRDNAFSEVLASYQENTGCCTTYLNQRYQDRGTLEHRITWQGGGSVWAIKAVGDPIWKVQASEVKNLHTIPRTTTTSRHGSNEIKQEQKVRWVSGKKKILTSKNQYKELFLRETVEVLLRGYFMRDWAYHQQMYCRKESDNGKEMD